MRKTKYKAYLIKRTVQYLDSKTGHIVELSSDAKLLDACQSEDKQLYIFSEVYQKLTTISGNTYNELNDKVYEIAEAEHLGFDFETYIIK